MTDRNNRGADVTDRLSKRFEKDANGPDDENSGNGESDTKAEKEEKDKSSKNDKKGEKDMNTKTDTSGMNAQSGQKVENVKQEWPSKLLYLPEAFVEEIDSEYRRLDYECGELGVEIKKNRHYYPVLAKDGVDAIAEMDGKAFRDRLDELNLLD